MEPKAAVKGFDLAALETTEAADEGRELRILNTLSPDTPFTGIVICLRGQDSAEFRRIDRSYNNTRLKAMVVTKGKAPLTVEGTESEELDKLVACTVKWYTVAIPDGEIVTEETDISGFEREDIVILRGERLECTPENVRKLYKKVPAIHDQVRDYIKDRANFTKGK